MKRLILNSAVAVFLETSLLHANAQYVFVRFIGGSGSGNGQFNECWSVAMDQAGNVYGGSGDNDCRIEEFNNNGVFLNQFAANHFPAGIAVSQFGNIFASAEEFNYVNTYNGSGTLLGTFGSGGTGNGQFDGPHGVALDLSGNVYIADEVNQRIEEFARDGTFIKKFVTPNFGNGTGYWGVAIDPWGNVYATHADTIEKFSSSGAFLGQIGTWGNGIGQYYDPTGLAVDASGNLFVADSLLNRVIEYSNAGAYMTEFGNGGGSGDGQFAQAVGVAVDQFGNVFVADEGNSRIEEFSPVPEPSAISILEIGFFAGFAFLVSKHDA